MKKKMGETNIWFQKVYYSKQAPLITMKQWRYFHFQQVERAATQSKRLPINWINLTSWKTHYLKFIFSFCHIQVKTSVWTSVLEITFEIPSVNCWQGLDLG